jgi:hypothetical protein
MDARIVKNDGSRFRFQTPQIFSAPIDNHPVCRKCKSARSKLRPTIELILFDRPVCAFSQRDGATR